MEKSDANLYIDKVEAILRYYSELLKSSSPLDNKMLVLFEITTFSYKRLVEVLHEKQIKQNYRPIIAVHKWFARRPGTLFRGFLLSEFMEGSLKDNFYKAHNLKGLNIADPFMGGGTPLIEANRLGCNIIGCDINPMAATTPHDSH